MRTTIRLDDHLLAEARRIAAATGKSLGDVIDDALRTAFAHPKGKHRSARPRLPRFRGKGLLPGVDLDDSAALLDRMEEPGAAH